jgi:hypothetical protein
MAHAGFRTLEASMTLLRRAIRSLVSSPNSGCEASQNQSAWSEAPQRRSLDIVSGIVLAGRGSG